MAKESFKMGKISLEWCRKFRRTNVTKEDVKLYNKKLCKYNNLEDYESYKKEKIEKIVSYLVQKYDPEYILMAKSQVDGYVIDERSTQQDIELKEKLIGRTKVSDFDLVVPGKKEVKRLSSLIVIDVYPEHFNNVKTITIYEK